MPLPVYDSEAEVPEAMRADYITGADGKWRYRSDEEVEVERRKRQQLLDEKKEEERKRKDAERQLEESRRTAEAKAKGVSGEELQRIRDDEAKARKPIEDENENLKKELRKLKLTDRVRALALKYGVMKDRLDDAMLVIEPRTELGDEDGIVYKDAAGKVTAQTETQFFEAIKKDKPWFFEFEGGSGSGSPRSDARGGSPTTTNPPGKTGRPAQAATVAGAF